MRIGTIGFPADQLVKLEKILKLSKNNRYALSEFDADNLSDLLLVFGEERLSDAPVSELPASYRSRIILVAKRRSGEGEYPRISFPLVSSRVIRALDKVTSENEELDVGSAAVDSAPEEEENRFEKYVEQARVAAASAPEKDLSEHKGYKVLVVDDSEAMQQALANELNKLPVPVDLMFASSGEEGLEKVSSRTPDIVFLDIMMPGIDGFETCTRMREIPEVKKTPIIMLSSKTSPLDEVKGIMAGCSTYLTKPIDPIEFQKVIKRVSVWLDEFKKPEQSIHSVDSAE